MADVNLSTAATRTVGAHRVYLKLSLLESWTEVPALHCDSVTLAAAPSYSTARLYWRYGVGKLPSELLPATITRQGVLRYYVWIDFSAMTTAGTLGFVGTVEIDADRLDDTGSPPSGRQALEAYGMERLLDLRPVRSSFWKLNDDDSPRESGSGLTFNAGGVGNRSPIPEEGGGFVFYHGDDAELWTSRTIVQYLLRWHAAIDFGELVGLVKWELDDDTLYTPTWDQPVIETHGRTVWEMLNQLYPRQRMLSFITRLADEESSEPGVLGIVNIRPFSFAHELIDLGDDAAIAANATPLSVDVSADHTADVVITSSTVDVCDRVLVEGAPRTTTCTLLIDDEELAKGWPDDLETEYEEAASTDANYPASTEPARRALENQLIRRTPRLASVFSRFALTDAFLETQKLAGVPVFVDDDDENAAHLVAPPLLEILPELTLLSGYSYGTNLIGEGLVAAFDDGPHVPRPPLILSPIPDDPESDPELRKWVDVRTIGQSASEEADVDEIVRNWSGDVRIPAGDRSIVIEVHGEAQHVLAGDEFTPLSALADHGERDIARWDYQEFTYTVTLQEDRRAQGRWPTGRVFQDIPREKYIFAGDKYRCDYVVPGTIVDVYPITGRRQTSEGGYVRDDRPLLQKIARVAHAWYGVERSSVTLSSSLIEPQLIPGVLLTQVGGRTVNAVVTSLSITIPRASGSRPGVPRATYTTQFGELDVLALFPTT